MKKTQFKDAFRGIQKRFISFLSIVLIVSIGAGAYYVTSFMSEGSKVTADEYLDSLNYMDFQMISSLGIEQKQIDLISQLDEVEDAEGVVQLTGRIADTDKAIDVTFITLSEKINIPEVVEGRLPENETECAVARDLSLRYDLKVGENIKVTAAFNDEEAFSNDTVKIVGIYNHPNYIRNNTSVYSVLVNYSIIDQDVLHDLFTRVLIRQKDNGVNTFEQEYFTLQEKLKDKLISMEPQLEDLSIDYLRQLALDKIEEKAAEIYKQFDDAQLQIDEALEKVKKELSSAWAKIASGKSELESSYNQLKEAEATVEYNEALLSKKISEFNAFKKKVEKTGIDPQTVKERLEQDVVILKDLEETMADPVYLGEFLEEDVDRLIEKLNACSDLLDSYATDQEVLDLADEYYENGSQEFTDLIQKLQNEIDEMIDSIPAPDENGRINGLDETFREHFEHIDSSNKLIISFIEKAIKAIKDYQNAPAAIKDAQQKLAAAKWQIEAGWLQYDEGKKTLDNAIRQYNTKKSEAYSELENAQNELDSKKKEAEEELEKARHETDDLKCNWILTDRRAETSYNDAYSNAKAIANAGKIFGILFAVVGSMVCFSTLIIIIEEERKLVGTSKAFGFRNNEILGKYMLFGVLSSLTGCLLAILLGVYFGKLMQRVIYNMGMFNTGEATIVVQYDKIIYVTLFAVLASAVVSALACAGLLKAPASALMKGQNTRNEKPKKNSSTSAKGSLYSRLIIRNMINDKARVIISIIIVAGSVLVIGTGFCIRDSFARMLDYQKEKVDTYAYRLDLGNSVSEDQKEQIEKILADQGLSYVSAMLKGTLYLHNNNLEGLNILVCDDDIYKAINILDHDSKERLALPEHGALIQNRMVENDKLEIGDSYKILDHQFNVFNVTYAGEYDNYIGRQIIMSKNAYEEAFGNKAVDNCFYVISDGKEIDSIRQKVAEISYDVSYNMADSLSEKFKSVLNLYNVIIVMMLGFAVIMSFMILTNLANIFVSRKKKELIVMRINGYSIAKTKQYLLRETVLTTVLGLILGVIAGTFLATTMIRAMEQADTTFVKDFNLHAWIYAVLIESAFALIVYYLSFRKIDHLNFREVA